MRKSYADQIADLEATRAEKVARMKELRQVADDESRSLNTAEAEEFDTLDAEVKTLDGDAVRIRKLERLDRETVTPVNGAERDEPVIREVRTVPVQARDTTRLEPGIAFARIARCTALAHIDHAPIADVARSMYPGDGALHRVLGVERAAVPAANTGSATWAGNLINEGGVAFADFVEYLRPRTLLGQIEGRLRRLPFDTPVFIQSTSGAAKWTKEGAAKPVTSWQYTRAKMSPLKVATIAAATKEQLRRASAVADALLRDELAKAVADRLNIDFIDPNKAAVADESPASILNGVAALPASGTGDYESVNCDIEALMLAFVTANQSLSGAFWVMTESSAVSLSLMKNPLGQSAFPGVTVTGGTLAGLPVFTSNYVDVDTGGAVVALVKGDEIFLGDEGGITVSISDQASILMDDSPSMNSTTPTAAQLVSLWQTNSVGFLVERIINWQRRRAASVAWMRVSWSACSPGSGA